MIQYSTVFGVLMITLVVACVSPADVDFEEVEQQLVVYSHFGSDEPMKLYLTHTRDPLKPNEPFEPVENAKIFIYEDEVLVDEFKKVSDMLSKLMQKATKWLRRRRLYRIVGQI